MTAVKIGSSVLLIGGSDPGLIAALAKTVGLSGHACALAQTDEAAEAFTKAAAADGVLVDVSVGPVRAFPYDPDRFDVVVLKDAIGSMRAYDRVLCLQQALRVLRAGGRCLVIEQDRPRGSRGVALETRLRQRLHGQRGRHRGTQGRGLSGGAETGGTGWRQLLRGDEIGQAVSPSEHNPRAISTV